MEPRPSVRAVSLLFSLATAGGLIGFGWERFASEGIPDALEPVPLERPAPARQRRTPEEEAVLQRALSAFPPYPRGGRPEVLAADYLGPGLPLAVAWFSTRDTPEQVLSHYQGVLLEAGLPVLGERHGPSAGYVGYWSPSTLEVNLVSVMAQGGETLVFVSSGKVEPRPESLGKVPEWIPLPARAEDTVAMAFGLEGTTQHMVSGRVSESTLPEVAGFFQRALSERGWSVEELQAPEDLTAALEVHRDGLRGQVVLRRELPSDAVDFHLSLTERNQEEAHAE